MMFFVFTESVGVIVESRPSLPPIDPSQPPPPGEETQTVSTSHIMPLMDVVSNVFSLIETNLQDVVYFFAYLYGRTPHP